MYGPSYKRGYATPKIGRLRYPEIWKACIGAWCPTLGDGGTRLFDHSGYNRFGTLTSMDPANDWAATGLDFDGSDDYVTCPSNGLGSGTWARSISFWMYQRDNTVQMASVGMQPTSGTARSFIVTPMTLSGIYYMWTDAQTTNLTCTSGQHPPLNQWNHISVTWNGSVVKYYLNGIYQAQVSYSSTVATITSIQIGRRTIGATGYFNGLLDDILIHNKELTPEEVGLLASQKKIAYEIAIPPAYKSTLSTTGTLSKTLDALTSSATGTVALKGTLTKTLSSLTSSATGTVALTGTLTKTLGSLTSTATGTVQLQGSLSQSLGAASLAATGTVELAGTLSKTLDTLTATSTSTLLVQGVLSKTLDSLVSTSTSTLALQGTLSKTLDSLGCTSTSTLLVQGTLTKTLDSLTCLATGMSGSNGSLTKTLDDLTCSSTSTLLIQGTLSKTLDSLGCTATSTLSNLGTLSKTLSSLTCTSTSTLLIQGTLSKTLDNLTCSATGTVSGGLSGSLSQTLAPLTSTATGTLLIQGSVTSTLDPLTLSATNVSSSGSLYYYTMLGA